MTGFASHERNTHDGILQVELRSVNQRYLELHLKLDDALRAQEPAMRDILKAKLGRGKVECRVQFLKATSEGGIQLNEAVLQQIARSARAVTTYFPEAQAIDPLAVLRMPGVMSTPVIHIEALSQDLLSVLELVVTELMAARGREGEKLKKVILTRLAEIESLITIVKPMLPNLVVAYQDKLLTKLKEAQLSQDEERIRQEIILYTQRIDVDEELSRLDAHVNEVRRILDAG
ncbi:MAG: YicC family protein, partial [Methylophilaceae bacterium]|nr:YicC family protein [Methylophilaceae bacterium]